MNNQNENLLETLDLSIIPTNQLTRELSKREGVREFYSEPFEPYELKIADLEIKDTGPAIVFIVIN